MHTRSGAKSESFTLHHGFIRPVVGLLGFEKDDFFDLYWLDSNVVLCRWIVGI